jgi:hypothetical protein
LQFTVTLGNSAVFNDLSIFSGYASTWTLNSVGLVDGDTINAGTHTFVGSFLYSGTGITSYAVGFILGQASASAVPGDHPRVVVRRGESLARIVRAHFKGSPFREDFIYKAFVAMNTEAFPRKTHHVVTAGASLRVPTHADLLAMAEGQSPAAAQGSGMGAAARTTTEQRKQWVRFP